MRSRVARCDELDQRRLEILAHRLEAQPAGARDRRGERAVLVEPHRLAAPDDAVDRVALEPDVRRSDADRLAAARFDEDVVDGQAGNGAQHARLAVLLPVAQQHHLRRERRVAVHGVERRAAPATRDSAPSAFTIASPPSIAHVGVDVDEAVALAASP